METIINISSYLAEIIAQGAASEFGMISLMIMAASIFGMILFRNFNGIIRFAVFLIFVGGLVLGGKTVFDAKREFEIQNNNLTSSKQQNVNSIEQQELQLEVAIEKALREEEKCKPKKQTVINIERVEISVREHSLAGKSKVEACDVAFDKATDSLEQKCNGQGPNAYVDMPSFFDYSVCWCNHNNVCKLEVEVICEYDVEKTIMKSPCN
jgi:hypothetical protein